MRVVEECRLRWRGSVLTHMSACTRAHTHTHHGQAESGERTASIVVGMMLHRMTAGCGIRQITTQAYAITALMWGMVSKPIVGMLQSMTLSVAYQSMKEAFRVSHEAHEYTTGLFPPEVQVDNAKKLRDQVLEAEFCKDDHPFWYGLAFSTDNNNTSTANHSSGIHYFTVLRHSTNVVEEVLLTSDDSLRRECERLGAVSGKTCQCTMGCVKGCGCGKPRANATSGPMPCCSACKNCHGHPDNCSNPNTASLRSWHVLEGRKYLEANGYDANDTFVSIGVIFPETYGDLDPSRPKGGQTRVTMWSILGVSCGPIPYDTRFLTQDFLQHVDLSGVNPKDCSIETCAEKNGSDLVKGTNEVTAHLINLAALTYKASLQDEAQRAPPPPGESTRMTFFMEKLNEAGVVLEGTEWERGAGVNKKPEDLKPEWLRQIIRHYGIEKNPTSEKAKQLCGTITKYFNTRARPERSRILADIVGAIIPDFVAPLAAQGAPNADDSEEPEDCASDVITPGDMARALSDGMRRLHESLPEKYPAPPKGLHGARSSFACEEVALRWWEHVNQDDALVEASSSQHTLQSARAAGLFPVQSAARPVIGSPGDMKSTQQMLGNPVGGVNAYFPKGCEPYVADPAEADKTDPLNMMGHPYNQYATVCLERFNFWKDKSKKHPADSLNGDKGKTQRYAAEVEKARLDNDVEQQHILAARAAAADQQERSEERDHDDDDDDDAEEVENDMTGNGIWVVHPGRGGDVCGTLVSKSPNGSVTVMLKGKGTVTNRTITVQAGNWSKAPPPRTFEGVGAIGIKNPEQQAWNPTLFPRNRTLATPPLIARELVHTPKPPLRFLAPAVNLFQGIAMITFLLFVGDLGELRFMTALQAQGRLRGAILIGGGLHQLFKVGHCMYQRAQSALQLNSLAYLLTNVKEGSAGAYAFEYDLERAAIINYALAMGHLALLMSDYFAHLATSNQTDLAHALLAELDPQEPGRLVPLFREWLTGRCKVNNFALASANYVSDFVCFFMHHTAVRSLNVDQMQAAAVLAMTVLFKVGSCPIYMLNAVEQHIARMIRPLAATQIGDCRSISPWKGLGNLLSRGMAFLSASVGGMYMDEIHESMNGQSKLNDPQTDKQMGDNWMILNTTRRLRAVLDSKQNSKRRHRVVYQQGVEEPLVVLLALLKRRKDGKEPNAIPADDPSLRDDGMAQVLIEIAIKRMQLFKKKDFKSSSTKSNATHTDGNALLTNPRIATAMAQRMNPDLPLELTFIHKNMKVEMHMSAYHEHDAMVGEMAAKANALHKAQANAATAPPLPAPLQAPVPAPQVPQIPDSMDVDNDMGNPGLPATRVIASAPPKDTPMSPPGVAGREHAGTPSTAPKKESAKRKPATPPEGAPAASRRGSGRNPGPPERFKKL